MLVIFLPLVRLSAVIGTAKQYCLDLALYLRLLTPRTALGFIQPLEEAAPSIYNPTSNVLLNVQHFYQNFVCFIPPGTSVHTSSLEFIGFCFSLVEPLHCPSSKCLCILVCSYVFADYFKI